MAHGCPWSMFAYLMPHLQLPVLSLVAHFMRSPVDTPDPTSGILWSSCFFVFGFKPWSAASVSSKIYNINQTDPTMITTELKMQHWRYKLMSELKTMLLNLTHLNHQAGSSNSAMKVKGRMLITRSDCSQHLLLGHGSQNLCLPLPISTARLHCQSPPLRFAFQEIGATAATLCQDGCGLLQALRSWKGWQFWIKASLSILSPAGKKNPVLFGM